jgi:hypothetical protein
MGVRFPSVVCKGNIATQTVTNTETALQTSPPISPMLAGGIVLICWMCSLVAATASTNIGIIIRRGSGVGGVQIGGTWLQACSAAQNVNMSGCWFDQPPEVANVQYTLTAQQISATANGNVGDVPMLVFVL